MFTLLILLLPLLAVIHDKNPFLMMLNEHFLPEKKHYIKKPLKIDVHSRKRAVKDESESVAIKTI